MPDKPELLILESIHTAGVRSLEEFASVQTLLNLPRKQLLDSLADVDAVICKSVTRVDREFLAAAPRLKVVGRAGTGTDNFDKQALAELGIPLLTVPTGNSISAAEFGVMCILMLAKRASEAIDAVRVGDFRRDLLEGRELSRMTIGLLGVGNVGRLVAARLQAFGCKVLGHDPNPVSVELARAMGVEVVASPAELLAASDLVSLHATIDEHSRGIINRETLARARPGLLLVNIARGGLMIDADVIEALNSGRIAFLAIDTLAPEPPYNAAPGSHSFDHPFLHHKKVVVFPHMAASTIDAQESIAVALAEKMKAALEHFRQGDVP